MTLATVDRDNSFSGSSCWEKKYLVAIARKHCITSEHLIVRRPSTPNRTSIRIQLSQRSELNSQMNNQMCLWPHDYYNVYITLSIAINFIMSWDDISTSITEFKLPTNSPLKQDKCGADFLCHSGVLGCFLSLNKYHLWHQSLSMDRFKISTSLHVNSYLLVNLWSIMTECCAVFLLM